MYEDEKLLDRIYPEFPAEEYEDRNAAAKAAMDKQGLDALFVTMRENVEYFTGYVCSYWGVRGIIAGVGIIPRKGEPVLVVPDFLRGTAERTAWVRNMHRHPHTHTKPRDFANAVIDAFREMGLEKGKIGYESGPELSLDMPIVDFEAVRTSLKDAKFVSGSDVIWACRSHKSPLEIENSMNLGASWRGYCGHTARYAFVGEPTEEHKKVDRLVGCIRDAMAEFLKPGINGEGLNAYVREAVAGLGVGLSRFGSIIDAPVGGINMGMNVHEYPRIAVGMKERTEAGMCIMMGCWLYDVGPSGMGVFSWEHPFIVTETGNRPLDHLRDEMWVV